jgi:hypothetical protein
MSPIERAKATLQSIGKQKRKYGSYGLIGIGFLALIEAERGEA